MNIREILRITIDNSIYLTSFFVSRKESSKKKIIIIRKDVVGDFIIFYPTLKFYREFYKDIEITMVCNVVVKDLTEMITGQVDKVLWYDQNKFRKNFFYRAKFMFALKREGYDIAIYPVYSREPIADLMVRTTRAKERIGFDTPEVKYKWLNNYYTKLIKTEKGLNEFDRNFAFVSSLTEHKCSPTFPTIDVSMFEKNSYESIVSKYNLSPKKYVVITPGSNLSFKIWQLNKFAEVADYLIEKGFTVLLSGTKKEVNLGEEIYNNVKHKESIVNLIGETDIPTLFHLLNNAYLYFGNDTGTLHMASAVGTKSLAIMGGGHFGRFFPYGDLDKNKIVFDKNASCLGDNWKCLETVKDEETAPCITAITVENVKKEISCLLSEINN